MDRIAIANYAREQWQRWLELAADRDDLEATWERWKAVKDQPVAHLRAEDVGVCEVSVDVYAVEHYCRHRGIANDPTARAEYVAEQTLGQTCHPFQKT